MFRNKILVLVCLLLFMFSTGFVYAQATTPDDLPNALQPKCGFADIPNANACCEKPDYRVVVIKPVTDMLTVVPVLGGLLSEATSYIIAWGLSDDPIRKNFERECITGVATDERDQKTGNKLCICRDQQQQNIAKPVVKLDILCNHYLSNKKERTACLNCANKGSILTGLGCIPVNFSSFITNFLLSMGIGFAGLFSLGCIIYSAIMIQTSQGNAEKISQSQDQIKACIFGLLIIAFSILILRIIGVDIIGVPGFS